MSGIRRNSATKVIRFNKRVIDALNHPDAGRDQYADTNTKYLRLFVTPTVKTWYYVRKVGVRTVFLKLGAYPEMTPDAARKAVITNNARYAFGEDVQSERVKGKITWKQLFQKFYDEHVAKGLKQKTARGYLDKNKLHLASIKNLPVNSIDQEVVETIHRRASTPRRLKDDEGKFYGKPIGGKRTADMTIDLIRDAFVWAKNRKLITADDPTAGVTRHGYNNRVRILSTEELGRFLDALDNFPDSDMADYFRLLLLTGQRKSKVASMVWRDLDMSGGFWTYDKTKNDEPMRARLAPDVVKILKRRRKDADAGAVYVFPSRRKDSKIPYLSEPKFAFSRLLRDAQIEGFRIHDLRRTYGTYMAATGATEHQLMKMLGHKDTQSTKVYIQLSDSMVKDTVDRGVDAILATKKNIKKS